MGVDHEHRHLIPCNRGKRAWNDRFGNIIRPVVEKQAGSPCAEVARNDGKRALGKLLIIKIIETGCRLLGRRIPRCVPRRFRRRAEPCAEKGKDTELA